MLGQSVIDIGANKGAYTYWLQKAVGPLGHVFAFEPQPELADLLRAQERSFGWTNTQIINAALSTSQGRMELFQPAEHPLGGATLEKHDEADGTRIEVRVERLDDYLDHWQKARPISFIKCDVEGHELNVFRGGERLLTKDRPILMFECHLPQSDELFEYLQSLGYFGGYAFINRRAVPFENFRWEGELKNYLGNFAFVHDSHRQRLQIAA